MTRQGWATVERAVTEELDEFAWLRGYFHDGHEDWDSRTWVRNLEEVRIRDLALHCLGNVKGMRGLDVGGGDGTYAFVLACLGADMAVQDLSQEAIDRGRRLAAATGLTVDFVCGDAQRLKFADNEFDFVFSADFFEHVPLAVKRAVFAEIFRVLRPGGLLVIKTPNLRYLQVSIWWRRFARLLRGKSPAIHIAHTRGNPDNEHIGLTTHAELARLCDEFYFHEPAFVRLPIRGKSLPRPLVSLLGRVTRLSPHVILSTRKSTFVGCENLPIFRR